MTQCHALSIDVEDWFQVLNMAHVVERGAWDRLQLRCADSTRRLLELLDRRGARATFFFLGWVAERVPELVREVAAAGHEVGSHGYDHRMLHDLGEQGFAADIERTSRILEGITGSRPRSFRACTWSITRRTPWAPALLARSGVRIDSSIQPVRHPDYGVPAAPVSPWSIVTEGGAMIEFPPLTLGWLGRRIPVGGGGYLRLFPLSLLRAGLRQQESMGMPGCIYLHPWEVDPGQPRQRLGWLRGFRHYVNLGRTQSKLDVLLQEYRFCGLQGAIDQRGSNWLAKLPAYRATELLG